MNATMRIILMRCKLIFLQLIVAFCLISGYYFSRCLSIDLASCER